MLNYAVVHLRGRLSLNFLKLFTEHLDFALLIFFLTTQFVRNHHRFIFNQNLLLL